MPYSTHTLVASEFRTIEFSSTTAVTDSEVTGFIAEHDALIDSYVGARYQLPITAPSALAILQMISRLLTACRVKDILIVKGVENAAADQETRGGCNREELMKMLERIKSGALPLTDAPLNTGKLPMSSYNSANDVEPYFKRGTEQW